MYASLSRSASYCLPAVLLSPHYPNRYDCQHALDGGSRLITAVEPPSLREKPASGLIDWSAIRVHARAGVEPHLDAHEALSSPNLAPPAEELTVRLAIDCVLVQ